MSHDPQKSGHQDLATISAPGVFDYVRNVGNRISPLKEQLLEETRTLFENRVVMTTDHIECELISFLVAAIGAKKALEVGVFTGASSLSIADALPSDGHLYALDISEEFTTIARKYWALAGVQDKVTLTLAPAVETLERYIAEGQSGTFDFAYLDADKENMLAYYKLALELLRPGGVIALDNVIWGGTVVEYNPAVSQSSTDAIRALNEFVHNDQRVRICMLPLSDGITVVLKK